MADDKMSEAPLGRLSYAARSQDRVWLSPGYYLALLVILAFGFFARVNELAAQSLWNDEGTSVTLARTSLAAIANAAAQDIHPPLYYFLLHFWIQAAGSGEFSLRFLSVLAGVLLIAVTFRIAREFFAQEVAVLAAALAAVNPFQVYYAQETRMYIWVTLFAALSVWMMIVMFKPPRESRSSAPARGIRRRTLAFLLYVVFTLAALYTNYYAFTLILLENLAFLAWLVWAIRSGRPRVGHSIAFWIAAQAIIALVYVPWLLFARASLTAWPGISEPMSLLEMTWKVLSAFVTGLDAPRTGETCEQGWCGSAWVLDAPRTGETFFALLFGFLFLAGLLPARDLFRQSVWGIMTCALWALVPLLAMYLVSLSRPAYNPKFLLLATPGFLILVARGMVVLARSDLLRIAKPRVRRAAWAGLALAAFLLGAGLLFALHSVYTDPRLQRDDYRGIVNYINAEATARDAVIVDAPGQIDVVRYYYRGGADLKTLPIGRPPLKEQTRNALADLVTKHDKLFAIYWATDQADPEQFVERSLSEVSYKASDEWHGNVRLAQYAVELEPRAFPGRIFFGDEIFLRRFAVADKPLVGGDIFALELVWVAAQPMAQNYKVFAHLLDAQGRIVAQYDGEPQNGFSPTSRWEIGEEVSDKLGILIPPGTPPGRHTLVIGVYRGDTGERLRLKNGQDSLMLGTLTVGKRIASRASVFAQNDVHADFEPVELFGYNLPRSVFARGELIPLVLYWQARIEPSADLTIQVQLLDPNNRPVATAQAFENYPSARWDAGEIVRDVQTLNLPADAPPGEYKIVVSDGSHSFDIARIQVR